VPHTYDDKFTLTESLVDTALSSHYESLQQLGLTSDIFKQFSDLSQNYSVLFRFSSTEKCSFLREETKEVPVGDKIVREGVFFTTNVTRYQKIEESFWDFLLESSVSICMKGKGKEECHKIFESSNNQTLTTSTKNSPRAALTQLPPIDLDANWLFREGLAGRTADSDGFVSSFKINRTDSSCFTPVRNGDSLKALRYFDAVIDWSEAIERYYRSSLFPLDILWLADGGDRGVAGLLDGLSEQLFVPVVPIMMDASDPTTSPEPTEQNNDAGGSEEAKRSPRFLAQSELDQCHLEERRTLEEGKKTIEAFMQERAGRSVLSIGHVQSLFILHHLSTVSRSLVSGIMSIEKMLERQLVSAIGRDVTLEDVGEYMKLRGQQLFLPEYRPLPMTYAVRRSEAHSPEGVVSLERVGHSSSSSPVLHTVVRRELMESPSPDLGEIPTDLTNLTGDLMRGDVKVVGEMSFSLSDSSRLTMTGERFIHSYLHQQFGTETSRSASSSLFLSVRARQFSGFIVLLGAISSSTSFEPTQAFIVQNKDELKIPLELEFIPSLQEFRRAISSLSPEQQQFAEAIRELQMSNTLFGVAIIQIKPQLEKVLNLPPDSLTKEIALTEDLLKLFIEYQIPSDLLSYDELSEGGEGANEVNTVGSNGTMVLSSSGLRSVEKVREHVKAIQVPLPSISSASSHLDSYLGHHQSSQGRRAPRKEARRLFPQPQPTRR
jgi:hypothetical protein